MYLFFKFTFCFYIKLEGFFKPYYFFNILTLMCTCLRHSILCKNLLLVCVYLYSGIEKICIIFSKKIHDNVTVNLSKSKLCDKNKKKIYKDCFILTVVSCSGCCVSNNCISIPLMNAIAQSSM